MVSLFYCHRFLPFSSSRSLFPQKHFQDTLGCCNTSFQVSLSLSRSWMFVLNVTTDPQQEVFVSLMNRD